MRLIKSILCFAGCSILASCLSSEDSSRAELPSIVMDNSDVSRFYAVVEKVEREVGKAASPEQKNLLMGKGLYEAYVQKGSLGLKEYFKQRFISNGDMPDDADLQKYGKRMSSYLPFLKTNRKAIEGHVLDNALAKKIMERMYSFLGKEYLELLSGKGAYFIIGAWNMGGGAFREGVFFDAAMIRTKDVNYAGSILEDSVNFLPKMENIDFLLAHEMIHTLQINISNPKEREKLSSGNGSLLKLALTEGGADFLASLVVGEQKYLGLDIRKPLVDYARNHPDTLGEFLKVSTLVLDESAKPPKDKEESSWTDREREAVKVSKISLQWFYNMGEDLRGRPADLGYYMGYLIARDYWDNNVKSQGELKTFMAIVESITGDEQAFLKKTSLRRPGS